MQRALRPFARPRFVAQFTPLFDHRIRNYYTENPNRPQDPEEKVIPTKLFTTFAQQTMRTYSARRAQAHVIPHPEKAGNCEDAFFISDQGNTFGIADGVGVWSELGINSALYSTALLQNVKQFIAENEDCTLYEALLYAYTRNLEAKAEGSSTVCLAKVVGRELHALNLGDSAFAIFRNNDMIYKSEEQSHSFNYPYQLGTGGDAPAKANCIQCTMKKGDLIVMGTDGLFDNLYSDEISEIIKASDPDKIAINLAVSAMAAACSQQRDTPFSEKVAEETDQIWRGGKMDDVTVVAYKIP